MAKKAKAKISKLKRNNQKSTKMARQGKLKARRNRPKQPLKQKQPSFEQPVTDESESEGVDDMVDQEDMDYIRQQLSRNQKLLSSVPTEFEKQKQPKEKMPKLQKKRGRHASESEEDTLEQNYEEDLEKNPVKKMRALLPFKTKDGLIMRETEKEDSEEEGANTVITDEPEKSDEGSDSEDSVLSNSRDVLHDQNAITTADLLLARREQLQDKKFRIGTLCSGLLEEPEKKLKNFFPLLIMMDPKNKDEEENMMSVRKLATVSIYEVFKDILPDYQIKHQDYSNTKLKKDTLALYKYEKELVEFYKRYLQRLEKAANILRKKKGDRRKTDEATKSLGVISLRCMCGMLVAKPNFNYAKNVIQTIVPFLNCSCEEARKVVNESCSTIFQEDKKGETTLMIVRRINHLVKSRGHKVKPIALESLLSLRIKDVNLDAEKKIEIKLKKEEKHKKRIINLSKKEKKRKKKLAEVEKELLETAAEENKVVKQRNLTEITTTVFNIYFRVIKSAPTSQLLTATLNGLSKFSHVINVEYYSDLVSVLDRLLASGTLGQHQRLLCIHTVFSILSGQGDLLNIDPAKFYVYLYNCILEIHAGATQAECALLLQALHVVCVRRARHVSPNVQLAYAKRLGALALQTQHHAALAALALLHHANLTGKAVGRLTCPEEGGWGSGAYDAEGTHPEHCAAHAAPLYELRPLQAHYHPLVRRAAARILQPDDNALAHLDHLSPQQIFADYDGSQMSFKPAIPPPQKTQVKKKIPSVHTFVQSEFGNFCDKLVESVSLNINSFTLLK